MQANESAREILDSIGAGKDIESSKLALFRPNSQGFLHACANWDNLRAARTLLRAGWSDFMCPASNAPNKWEDFPSKYYYDEYDRYRNGHYIGGPINMICRAGELASESFNVHSGRNSVTSFVFKARLSWEVVKCRALCSAAKAATTPTTGVWLERLVELDNPHIFDIIMSHIFDDAPSDYGWGDA